MKLLRNRDNGGLCPFKWQEFRVFGGADMAVFCRRLKPFTCKGWNGFSGLKVAKSGGLLGHLGQAVTKSVNNQLEPVGNVEFREHRAQMMGHCRLAYEQSFADLLVL